MEEIYPNLPDRDQMDFLDILSDEEVTRVFHCKKTEMSCMEEPHTFLNQLRDHDLVPEKLYKKVKKERCHEKKDGVVYQILDWLEKNRENDIKLFWKCVFQQHILQKYSVLRSLRNSFLNDAERKCREETQTENTPMEEQREKSTQESKEEPGSPMSCKPISDVQAACDDGETTSNATTEEKRNECNEEMNEKAGSPMLCELFADVQAEWDDVEKTSNATTKEKGNENIEKMNEEEGSISINNTISDAERKCRAKTQTENTPMEEQREKSTEESKEEAGSPMLCELFANVQAAWDDEEKTSNATTKEKGNENIEKMNEEADAERKCREETQTENTLMEEQREKSTQESKEEAGSPMLCELFADVQAAWDDEEKTSNATTKEKRKESNEETNEEAGSIGIFNHIPDAEMTSGKEMQTENLMEATEEQRENSAEESKEEAGSPMLCELLADVQAEWDDVEKTSNTTTKEKSKEKKRKRKESNEETNEEAGPIPKKKAKASNFSTEPSRNRNTEDFSENQLPVTCEGKTGVLYKDKLAEGTKCILSEGHWFTTNGFENFAGKGYSRNWKLSIRNENIPLLKLIKEGQLKCFQMKSMKHKKQSPKAGAGNSSPETISSEESEESDDEEGGSADKQLFRAYSLPVSCGSVCGILYKQRFTGPRTKSIRTEERWFSPKEFINQHLTLTCGHWKTDILCHGKNLNYLLENSILSVHKQLCECKLCLPKNPKEHDNDDVCFICNTGGNLVCCDNCPRAFHKHCHLPALNNELRDQWMCTFCVFKTNKTCNMTEEEALNQPISNSIMHCEYLLLCMYKWDSRRVFTKDPIANVKNSSRVIASPMMFNQVRTKLENNEYRTVREFVLDVQLIFTNGKALNKGNEFARMGTRLHSIFKSEFLKVFKILH